MKSTIPVPRQKRQICSVGAQTWPAGTLPAFLHAVIRALVLGLVVVDHKRHPFGQEFDFMDGNWPYPQVSRNSVQYPVDVSGASLKTYEHHSCGQSYVATGTFQLCDRSPNSAKELLQGFKSQATGKSMRQHLASLHESILFQASEADGVLDDSTIKPSWSGSNWTYQIPFLDKKSANNFVTFLERDLATDLSEQEGLSCANVQPSEEIQIIPASQTIGYSARVRTSICGAGDSDLAATVSEEIVHHLLESYSTLIYPRLASQILANVQETINRVSCSKFGGRCCCRKPLSLDFVVTFGSSENAARFDRYLIETGGEFLRPSQADCEFCASIEEVDWSDGAALSTAGVDMLICSPLSIDEVIQEIRKASPMGHGQTVIQHMKSMFPSIRAPLSDGTLISKHNVWRLPGAGHACGDDQGNVCCKGGLVWSASASFADEEDARRFVQFVSSDLTANLVASKALGTGSMSGSGNAAFIKPVKKGLNIWHEQCPTSEDFAAAASEGHADDALRWLAEAQKRAKSSNQESITPRKAVSSFPSQRLKLGLEPFLDSGSGDDSDLSARTPPRKVGGRWFGSAFHLLTS